MASVPCQNNIWTQSKLRKPRLTKAGQVSGNSSQSQLLIPPRTPPDHCIQQLVPHPCVLSGSALLTAQHEGLGYTHATFKLHYKTVKAKFLFINFQAASDRAGSRIPWSYTLCHRAEHKSNNFTQLLHNRNFSLKPVVKQWKPLYSFKCKSMFGLLFFWSVWGFFPKC